MSMTPRAVLSVFCGMLLSLSASATTYNFDYSYDGATVTENLTAAGSTLEIGDTVVATIHSTGGYWQAQAGDLIWVAALLEESATRFGDMSWAYLRNGVTVDSASQAGVIAEYIHVGGYVPPAQDISFDTLTWTYVLTSSTSPITTFSPGYFASDLTLAPATFISSVPEQETYVMLLAGLMTVGAIARRRRRS